MWLAGLSVAADALALILPAAGRTLWQDGKRGESLIAWGLWGTTIVIALLATIGFASLNIADTTAARGRIADENAGVAERVARLRAERTAVAETRSVNAIEAELQRGQPRAAAVWHATAGCTDVTRGSTGCRRLSGSGVFSGKPRLRRHVVQNSPGLAITAPSPSATLTATI